MPAEISRRTLVELIGRIGGAAAAYSALNMAGLLVTPTAHAAPPALKPGSGNGKRRKYSFTYAASWAGL